MATCWRARRGRSMPTGRRRCWKPCRHLSTEDLGARRRPDVPPAGAVRARAQRAAPRRSTIRGSTGERRTHLRAQRLTPPDGQSNESNEHDTMNDRTFAADATRRIADLLAAQRAAFAADPYPSAEQRRERLRALKRQLGRYQDRLTEAIGSDFGGRSADESMMLDLIPAVLDINHAISHLARWMRPSRRSTELMFLTNRLRVHYQPKGVVGVVATWNYPVYLSLGPLVAALAAGNRAMIKMPDVTPATNAVLRQLLADAFDETEVALVGDELADPSAFTALAFDHLVFTGSPNVGRAVMRQAAEHLTPVTLELGGKSPALVLRGYRSEEHTS